MKLTDLQELAFIIIAYSGSASEHFHNAVNFAKVKDFKKSQLEIKEGDKELSRAHISQTKLLTAEANEEKIPFSIIMVHAQDHLMSTILYRRIADDFINMYKEGDRNE